MAATTAILLGCTGMVGAQILTTLRASSSVTKVHTISRRAPPSPEDLKTESYVNPDTSTWSGHVGSIEPPPSVLYGALATTRGAAGGFDKQYRLEHDLNVELARIAKNAGTKVYVLISSASANPDSYLGYTRMKGEIEKHIEELEFEHTVILRPGLISGHREEKRVLEGVIRKVADVAGKVSTAWLKDAWAQDAEVIARAAVKTGQMAANGEVRDKVWTLGGKDIIRYGRTEWKD